MTAKTDFSTSALGSSIKWAFAMNWGRQSIGGLVTFILAALLGPEEFGVLSLAMVYLAFIEIMLEQGLGNALVQRKNLSPQHADSAFWMILAMSTVLCLISIACGGWWARLCRQPVLGAVINALSVLLVLQGLSLVQQALLRRELGFKKLAIRSNVAELVGGVAGIGAALRHWGIWALVAQQLTREIISLVLLWNLGKWRPRWRFSWPCFRDLLGFSVATFMASLANFMNRRAEIIILGLYLGPTTVGLLRFADRLREVVLALVTRPLTLVSLPNLARVQDRKDDLKRQYLIIVKTSALLTIPTMGILATLSEPILRIVGEQWLPARGALTVMWPVGMIMALTLNTGPLLQAVCQAKRMAILLWALALGNLLCSFFVAWWLRQASVSQQTLGFALSRLVLFLLLYLPLNIGLGMKYSGTTLMELLTHLRSSLVATGAALVVAGLIQISQFLNSWPPLIFVVVVGGLSGLAACWTIYQLEPELRSWIQFHACSGWKRLSRTTLS